MKYRRPRYMNGGGIASLEPRADYEAMLLELEGEPPFNMQEAMDEELEIHGFDNIPPDLMRMIGEMLIPGAGMVKMGKGVSKIGEQGLKKARKMLNMDKYSPKGQEPRPPSLGTERSKPPEIPKYIPKKKPPEMRSGGALSYKKGYYGKSYK